MYCSTHSFMSIEMLLMSKGRNYFLPDKFYRSYTRKAMSVDEKDEIL